ncbi:MAG: exodeoxyribonuclease V subunit alpha [Moraxella sp.]|nr:exodeoxyribonuclease V subunit alpha [Moraxella sp.]
MNTQIGMYLKNRTIIHHQLYKKHIDDDFTMTVIDDTIFYLLYFIINHSLRQGHTVVRLKSNWQTVIIDFIKNHVNDELGFDFNFKGVFDRIDELSYDTISLKNHINISINSIKSDYQKQEIINHIHGQKNDIEKEQLIKEISQVIRHLLRFYYYINHKEDGSLSAIINIICRHCFFGNQNSHQDRPIIWQYQKDGVLYLWLNRIYHAELSLLSGLSNLYHTSMITMTLSHIGHQLNTEQQRAVYAIANQGISIITGGPGTGKTFTIAQAVMALNQKNKLKLALVAPTGKASQRMKESLQNALKETTLDLPEPMTIHRLLGIGTNGLPRHDKNNPLPFELIIVDEASMVGVELASQLFNAMKQGTRLVLLGDTHQLFAVEAGSVLSDLCDLPMIKNNRIHLIESRRFHQNSGVGKLANLINSHQHQSYDNIIHLINQYQDISYQDINGYHEIEQLYEILAKPYYEHAQNDSYFELTKQSKYQFYRSSDDTKKQYIKLLNDKFNEYRILCASHMTKWGDVNINHHIKKMHQSYLKIPPKVAQYTDWYHGRPVIMLKNRYDLGLFNGDIGICLQNGKKANELAVFFYGETIKSFPISMLTGDMVSTAYAMTVHKSQGSEFEQVAVVCHDANERLLCKELLYTAITRAKMAVSLYTTPSALSQAVNNPTLRQTGLAIHEQGRAVIDSEI